MTLGRQDQEVSPWLGECERLPGLRLIRARAVNGDFRRHNHRSMLVGVVQHGPRLLQIPNGELCVLAGNGFLLPAGLPHRCAITQAHSYRVVSIALSLWRELGDAPPPRQAKILSAGSSALLAARRLIATLRSNPEHEEIKNSLIVLLGELIDGDNLVDSALAVPAKLLTVRDWLETHCTETVRLTTLAQLADGSPTLINRRFSQHFGVPPYEYLLQLRLGIAARRLRENDLSLADIAYETGFSDQSHLQRFFRRAYGTTPKGYRQASLQLNLQK